MNDNPLEKTIEQKVCDYAKSKGYLTPKFTSPARRSVPDRLMIPPVSEMYFIEFKRLGAKATDAQLREHERLRKNNKKVFVVDTVEMGKFLVDLIC